MEIGSIFLLLAVLLLASLFVARPFFEGRRMTAVSADEQALSALMADRDRLILTLQELEFDHVLHKIPAEDYPTMRADLMQKAADVLRQLDAFQAKSAPTDAESRLEAVIAARRADAAPSARKSASIDPTTDDSIEAMIAARKASRKEKSGGFCAKCGKAILVTDHFCPNCGQSLR
jgi:hypothetical protein